MAHRVCPYPGLRPFNEEEAIFFKGRDLHISQICEQLSERKFLMLTGASGDGKSSLVYGGAIPQAHAGFFKAKFNNWVIADFRPETSPLRNLANALFRALKLSNEKQIETELSFGFSALVDVYKSSNCYLDTKTYEFLNLDNFEQKALKKKGANLLILVDQFEEFFTNSENYASGKLSNEAITVLNLLLETAKLALDNDLPIYIICTMRSDYFEQCASFKGLPEYIGFSQFFVPRLRRSEIKQVIEIPALLNGDRISNRLVETLLNSLDDGFDQLPVLQHALNQIWHYAGDGTEEMDLIHYAKAGGLPVRFLDPENKEVFDKWFNQLPEYKKAFYNHPSLNNVLDTHANNLYEIAAWHVNTKYPEYNISETDAKYIIEVAFKSLSKYDGKRAVRNRIALQDIVNIINRPELNTRVVNLVLNIFRIQGNTFLRPFINDEATNEELQPNTVLDITHESLIRNWTLLTKWAKEENENYVNYLDLKVQLDRWLENNKSSGFFLSIGSLSFFEKWLATAKPNKYWLAKYNDTKLSREQKLALAEVQISNINTFIKASRNKIKKRRMALIGSISAVIIVLVAFSLFSGFQANVAEKQSKIAIQKTREALSEKNLAERAKEQSAIAARQALAAKDSAEKEKVFALMQMRLADSQKNIANKERELAKYQEKRANENYEEAFNQKVIANNATTEAQLQLFSANREKARSERLNRINLAQNLAFKSQKIKYQPQLAGLLAYEAAKLAHDNDADQSLSSDIYSALLDALKNIMPVKFDPVIKTKAEIGAMTYIAKLDNITNLETSNAISSIRPYMEKGVLMVWLRDGKLEYYDNDNTLIKSIDLENDNQGHNLYNGNNNKRKAGSTGLKHKTEGYFISKTGDMGVTVQENNSIRIWDFEKLTSSPELLGHSGSVRCVAFSKNEKAFVLAEDSSALIFKNKYYNGINRLIVTAGDDSTAVIWKDNQLYRRIKFSAKIKSIDISNDNNQIMPGCEDGGLYVYNLAEDKGIDDNLNFKITLKVDSKTGEIVDSILYNKGGIQNVQFGFDRSDFSNNTRIYTTTDGGLFEFNSDIKKMHSFQENSKIDLMCTYFDCIGITTRHKNVHIYHLDNSQPIPSNFHPIEINEFISSIALLHNYIAIATKNAVYKYPININYMKNELLSALNRNLTEDEWKEFIGSEIPYEKFIGK